MKPTTREWVRKAEDDFKVASQILRRRKDVVPDVACFHCQQCIEKYLKARLLEAGIAFPRTHNLLQLLSACIRVEPLWSRLCENCGWNDRLCRGLQVSRAQRNAARSEGGT